MTGRGAKTYYRQDNGKAITGDDIYHMVMLYRYQKMPLHRIARQFSLKTVEVRTIIGKSQSGSCCG